MYLTEIPVMVSLDCQCDQIWHELRGPPLGRSVMAFLGGLTDGRGPPSLRVGSTTRKWSKGEIKWCSLGCLPFLLVASHDFAAALGYPSWPETRLLQQCRLKTSGFPGILHALSHSVLIIF